MSPETTRPKRLYDYRITARGEWLCEGNPIQDPDLLRLLSCSLTGDRNGRFWVKCQGETHPVRVEDAPLLVERLEPETDDRGRLQGVVIVLADKRVFALDDTLRLSPSNRLYLTIRKINLEALPARGPFYELTRYLEQDRRGYYIPVAGKHYYVQSREETGR